MAIDPATGKEAVTPPALPAWAQSLSPELQAHPSAAKFKDPADIFKSYIETEKILGAPERRLILPTATDPKEAWNPVYEKLGRPKTAEDYAVAQIIQGIKLPEGFTLDPVTFGEFAKQAHALGITTSQMKGIIEFYAASQGKAFQDLRAAQDKEVNDAETTLRTEWGLSYEQNRSLARKALNVMFGKDAEAMAQSYGADPAFVRGLYNLGTKLSEDVLGEGGSRSYTMTPEQAKAEIGKIQADPKHPVWQNEHPEHKAAVEAFNSLYAMAYPGQSEND